MPSAHPHIITTPARTGTNVELRIHTSLTVFEVAAGQWAPAVSGFVVTVLVHSVDTATGLPRYLPTAEPHEWARAIFADIDAAQGYFLGAVDPDTGEHRDEQQAYRLYLDTDRQAIRVPHPNGRLPALPDAHRRHRSRDSDRHHCLTSPQVLIMQLVNGTNGPLGWASLRDTRPMVARPWTAAEARCRRQDPP